MDGAKGFVERDKELQKFFIKVLEFLVEKMKELRKESKNYSILV